MKPLLAASVAVIALVARQAGAATPSKCASAELGAAGKKAATKVKCWAKATGKGVAVDTECLSGAETKFSAAYLKAQGKGDCVTTTAAGTIETTVDAFVADLVMEIDGSTGTPTASKCSSKELAATGKKTTAVVKCYAKAAAKADDGIIAPCIATAQAKFGTAWTKASAAADCNSTIDQATIETKVDDFAANVNGQLAATGTTTTTMCTPATCGSGPAARCGTISDGCGGTLSCAMCAAPDQCCDADGLCQSPFGALRCRALDGTCAAAPSADCPCCSATGSCVSSCGSGACCSNGLCDTTNLGTRCQAADGTCASPGSASCFCCRLDGACVTGSCGPGECCGGGVCESTLGGPPSCRAADGTCASPPSPGCSCCDSTGDCVSACNSGQCCAGFTCKYPFTCAALGANCGSIIDNNCGGTLSCGTCTAPETCGGGGTPNVCGCTDNGAACAGRVCGSVVNNCGQHVSCGTCPMNTPKCCVDTCVCSTCLCP